MKVSVGLTRKRPKTLSLGHQTDSMSAAHEEVFKTMTSLVSDNRPPIRVDRF